MSSPRRRIGAVAVAEGLAAALVAAAAWRFGPPVALWQIPLVALAFAGATRATVELELRRHSISTSAAEAVVVVALFMTAPAACVLGVALGEVLDGASRREDRLKLGFNVAQVALAVGVASLAFHAVGGSSPDPADQLAWVAALAAVLGFLAVNAASTAYAVSRSEGRSFGEVLRLTGATVPVTSLASGSAGLVVAVLAGVDGAAPLLLVPALAVVALAARNLTTQRAERLRFERLHAASERTAQLASLDAVVADLAEAARGLVTGSTAVCALRRGATWSASALDDDGPRPLGTAEANALSVLGALDGATVVAAHALDPVLGAIDAAATNVVVGRAGSQGDAPTVVLVVFRTLPADRDDGVRAAVLAAFATHAALATANAALFEDVEDALRRQVDLNRQKADFVAAVSHELRTPLTGVVTAVATMRRLDAVLTAERRDRLFEMAASNGARLNRLVDDLLAVAAADHSPGPVGEPVDVAAVVAGVAGDLEPLANGRLVLSGPATAWVRTDGGRVRQIVANLVENAVKYAPVGPVEVVTRQGADGTVTVSVVDRGPGVPAADRERVFERFVQLDQTSTRRAGGTGLGLHLCRQLAAAIGAHVDVADTPGGGATFSLRLPAEAVDASDGDCARPGHPQPDEGDVSPDLVPGAV